MAKKIKNPKLLAPTRPGTPNKNFPPAQAPKRISAFQQHANQLELKRKKKQEKKQDAVSRLVKENKVNRVADLRMKTSTKKLRFDLDDVEQRNLESKLTHRGKNIDDIDQFNQIISASEDEGVADEMVEKTHFAGFMDDESEMQQQNDGPKLPKTKKQIYEEIMAKSKLFKQAKQQQLEDNFEKAVELDKNLPNLIPQLKFRGERVQTGNLEDKDFLELMEDLKQDARVESQKPVTMQQEKRELTKRRLKKQQYLEQLQAQGDDEDVDVRGFVRGVVEEGEDEEQEEDELDEVNLSSDEEDEDEQDQDDDEEEGDDDQDDDEDQQEDGEQYSNEQQF